MTKKFKLEIIQDDYCESTHKNIRHLMQELFDEWRGWNWIKKSKFLPKGEFFVCFKVVLNDGCEIEYEISWIDELTVEMNKLFKSFKNGYEKEYKITVLENINE